MAKLYRCQYDPWEDNQMPASAQARGDPKLDEVRQRILTLCEDQGVSLRDASIKLGKNPAYLQQFIHRGTPGTLPERTRVELAALLGVQAVLLAPEEMRRHLSAIRRMEAATNNYGARLPIAGYAKGGLDLLTFNDDEPSAYIDRPGELEGVDEAFAVEVVGESHAPRCKPGEVLAVNPRLTPSKGSDVVVRMTDGSAIIGEYVRRSSDTLELLKGADGLVEIPTMKIAGVYTVTHIIARPNRYGVQ
jgi:SOS-response transcriptional repressor LexA